MSNQTPNLAPSAAVGAAGWSDERVEKLKTLAAEGYSASQIAKTLGRVSRSAVIGKLHRLGLNARAQPATPGQRAPISRKAVEGKSTPARRPKTEAEQRADGLRAPPVKTTRRGGKTNFNIRTEFSDPRPRVNGDGEPINPGEPWVPLNRYDRAFQPLEGTIPRPFLERRTGQCRWPIDGADGEFLSCCEPSGIRNYCDTHHALGHTASIRKPSGDDLIRAFRKVA